MKKNRIILIVLAVIVTALLCGCGIKSDASFGALPDGVYGYTYSEEGIGGPFYRTKSYLLYENSAEEYIKHSRTMSGKTYPVERLDTLTNNAPEHDRETIFQVIDYTNTQFGEMFLLSSSANRGSIVLFIDNTRYDIPKPEDYEYANWQISDEKITIFTRNSERSKICCLNIDISTGNVENFEIEVNGKIYTDNMMLKDGVLYYYTHSDNENYVLVEQYIESDEYVDYEFQRRPISFHLLGDGNLLLTSCLDSKICVEQINSDGELVSENYVEFPDGLHIDNLSEDVNIYLYGNTLYGYRRTQNGRALFACELGASTPHFFFDLSKIEKKSGIVSYTKFMIERDGQLFDILPYIQNGETAENTELHQNSALQSTSLILPVANVSPQYAEVAQKILDSFYFVSDEIPQSYFDLTWRELEKELDPKLSHMPDGSEDYSLLQQYCYEPNGIDTYFLGHDEAAEELRNGKSLPEIMVISKTAADDFYNTINQVRILYGFKEPAAVMGEAQYHQYTDDGKHVERLNSMLEWVTGPTTALFLNDNLMRMLESEGFSLNDTQAMSVSIMAHSNGIYFTDGTIERYYPQEIWKYTPLLSVGKMYSIDVLAESLETISFADANMSLTKKVYAKTVSRERLGSQVDQIGDIAIYNRSNSYRVYDIDFGWYTAALYTGKVIALPENSEKGYVIGKYDTDVRKGWGGAGFVNEDVFCWFYGNEIAFYDRDSFEILDFPLEFKTPQQPEYQIHNVWYDAASEEFVILYRPWTPMSEERMKEVRYLPDRWEEQNSHLEIQRFTKDGRFIDMIDIGIMCGEDVVISNADYNNGLLRFWHKDLDGEYFTYNFKTGEQTSFEGDSLLVVDDVIIINKLERNNESGLTLVTSTWLEEQKAYNAEASFDFNTEFSNSESWTLVNIDKQNRIASIRRDNVIFDFSYTSGRGVVDYSPLSKVFEQRPVIKSANGRYEIYDVGNYSRDLKEYACLDAVTGEVYPMGSCGIMDLYLILTENLY